LTAASAPSVVVPTHAGGERLARLLESLAGQTMEFDLVVVDNASPAETQEVIAARAPAARVIRLDENVGFGRAVNRGLAATSSSSIVLVNDDAACEPEFVERLVARLDPANDVVMAAGVLLSDSEPSIIDTAGVMFDRTLLAFDYLHGEHVSALETASDPFGPTGGAAAFDRRAFDAVGGFDDAFFAYLEDVDLTARMLARGGRCRLAPGARAIHHHSATLGSASNRKNALMGWSRGYTLGKYRLHRHPHLFGRALAGELVIGGGQLLIDGTPVSISSRIRGLRAGVTAPAEKLPELPVGAAELSLLDVLRQRKRRRAR
jgi:GT2 family glycosyltransferase